MLALASIVPILLAAATLALPSPQVACSLSSAKLTFPSNVTVLTAPSAAPEYIGLGVGVQNYTCNTTSSTYVLFGAVAELFDLSCIFSESTFGSVQDSAFNAWTAAADTVDVFEIITDLIADPAILGQHYYVDNPAPAPGASAESPKFDFTSAVEKGNSNAFVVGAKVGDLPAPTGPSDIDWVQLKEVAGQLAGTVFRTNTRGGQPPKSCSASSPPVSIKYAAKYWFFK
ncbi:hypothetical protein FIBSPDRAFT_783924 [Athelia psychrophila]|uniref:Malate dehydrogenase n=1 Tax=Athelia psychrophila TaxID=1759441 RepID=A0A166NI37_9AGAM|nr:hypothetical protein FIBSPDRAFT_783924 [Fibularhizoctonia sp. CBS 109695]